MMRMARQLGSLFICCLYLLQRVHSTSLELKSGKFVFNEHSDVDQITSLDADSLKQWVVNCKGNYSAEIMKHYDGHPLLLLPPSSIVMLATSSQIKDLQVRRGASVESVSLFRDQFKYRAEDILIDNGGARISWNIHLIGFHSNSDIRSLTDTWKMLLRDHVKLDGAFFDLYPVSSSRLLFTFEPPIDDHGAEKRKSLDHQWMANWFSNQDIVHWISPISGLGFVSVPLNAAAKMRTQSEGVLFNYESSEATPQDWRRYPISQDVDATAEKQEYQSSVSGQDQRVHDQSEGYGIIGGCISTEFGCCASDGVTPRRKIESEYGCPSFAIRT